MIAQARISYRFVRTPLQWLAILAILSVAACSRPSGTLPTTSPTQPSSTLTQVPATPSPLPTETPAPATPEEPDTSIEIAVRSQYSLTARLNYSQHLLTVSQEIRYVNASQGELIELRLMVPPADYPGVFQLERLSLGDGQPIEPAWEGSQIVLPLTLPLPAGAWQTVQIDYSLHLPSPTPSAETRPVPFGYTARQTNLVDWYPFIPPYSHASGWLAHAPGFFGEHLVYEPVDFSVTVHLEDQRNDLTIVASAPTRESQTDQTWHYQHLEARSFAWSVSPEYQQLSTSVGEVTIHSYAFGFHQAGNEAVLQTTAQALALYEELFGPYPHQQLSVVEADFLDGMEYDGLYFLSNGFYNLYQGTPGEYLVAIAAHETAHQWFYGLVGNDQALEPWLDEALCTYAERLYYERYAPQALDWWWTYRIEYYDPRGRVDGSIYNPEGYRAYRDAIYLNGAVFLEELRIRMGDEDFFDFLRAYVSEYQGEIATTAGFFALLSEYTDADLGDLIRTYFPSLAESAGDK